MRPTGASTWHSVGPFPDALHHAACPVSGRACEIRAGTLIGDWSSLVWVPGTGRTQPAENWGLGMSRTDTGEPLRLFIDGLATFRLVKLVRHDRITEPVREAVRARWGPPEKSRISYLIDCPWCLSFYFAVALTVLGRRWPRPVGLIARSLALSALTGLAAEHVDSSPDDS